MRLNKTNIYLAAFRAVSVVKKPPTEIISLKCDKSVVKRKKERLLLFAETLNFEGVGAPFRVPPSVMNEILICVLATFLI